jgi:hypothetical protein
MLDFEEDYVVHVATSVQTTTPEAAKALEQAWKRRRAELADWQPSGGWLADRRDVRHHARFAAR